MTFLFSTIFPLVRGLLIFSPESFLFCPLHISILHQSHFSLHFYSPPLSLFAARLPLKPPPWLAQFEMGCSRLKFPPSSFPEARKSPPFPKPLRCVSPAVWVSHLARPSSLSESRSAYQGPEGPPGADAAAYTRARRIATLRTVRRPSSQSMTRSTLETKMVPTRFQSIRAFIRPSKQTSSSGGSIRASGATNGMVIDLGPGGSTRSRLIQGLNSGGGNLRNNGLRDTANAIPHDHSISLFVRWQKNAGACKMNRDGTGLSLALST